MRPLKRETRTAQMANVQPVKIPHQIAGDKLAIGLAAANDQAQSRKGLLTRRRKRHARRSIH
ncbi:MAG: hypothetical protein AAF683_07485 [Pseudomonadota bacterium]